MPHESKEWLVYSGREGRCEAERERASKCYIRSVTFASSHGGIGRGHHTYSFHGRVSIIKKRAGESSVNTTKYLFLFSPCNSSSDCSVEENKKKKRSALPVRQTAWGTTSTITVETAPVTCTGRACTARPEHGRGPT